MKIYLQFKNNENLDKNMETMIHIADCYPESKARFNKSFVDMQCSRLHSYIRYSYNLGKMVLDIFDEDMEKHFEYLFPLDDIETIWEVD